MQSDVPRISRSSTAPTTRCGCRRSSAGPAQAGFEQVSLDLIYGTPGESLADWQASLDAALACTPEHVSAYSLIVEEGTALARRVARGELPAPDEDDLADKYVLADERLSRAGLGWYEVSNWARDEHARCRHNLGYWTGADWWGVGPGAHSHVGGVRWWNVKHPAAYAERINAGVSPAHAREILDAETRRVERVLLELRLRDGLPVQVLDATGRAAIDDLVRRGLLERAGERLVLTAGPAAADAAGCCRRRGPRPAGPEPTGSAHQADGQRVAVVLAVGRLDRRLDDRDEDPDQRDQASGMTMISPRPMVMMEKKTPTAL